MPEPEGPPAAPTTSLRTPTRSRRRASRKLGKAPGTIEYTGEARAHRVRLTLTHFDSTHYERATFEDVNACLESARRPGVAWVHVGGVHNTEIVRKLGTALGIHPLVLEDVAQVGQRPKFESHGDYGFVVFRFPRPDPTPATFSYEQFSLIFRESLVLSFIEREEDPFDPVRSHIEHTDWRPRGLGADYLAYALCDHAVDHCFLVLEKLEEQLAMIESTLQSSSGADTFRAIRTLQSEVDELRRSIRPVEEATHDLEHSALPFLRDETRVYLKDLTDHAARLAESADALAGRSAELVPIYNSAVNVRTNEIMKVLTIIATLFIPPTFVASIYGMNFRHMPELDTPWGYGAALVVMGGMIGGMLLYARRKGWI